ncbi:MAG TPA: hypothetical protein VL400_22685 [Polyangiaceae bacterium]|nr:hypothetical protein [Polyangiaceae bacterium]
MISEDTVIHAQLEVSECTAELYVNGVPVTRIAFSPTRIPIENVAVMQLLVPGTNTIEIVVEPGSTPSRARDEKREEPFRKMHAIGRLIRFGEGVPGLVEHGDLLAEVAFRWQDASVDRQTFPQATSMQVEMGAAFGRWGWQNGADLVLDEATVAEAIAVLDEVESAIRAFHADRFWALTKLQIDDVLKAYPAVTEEYLRGDLASMMKHFEKGRDPVVARDPAKHDFRIVGGGKLLQCIDEDWSTSFKLRDPSGGEVPYTIFLARIDGRLRIVR